MKEQLIEFSTAKLAKEKGFNIPTLYGCNEKGEFQEYFTYESYSPGEPEVRITDFIKEWEYQLPTQSLLQKWLREVHNIEFDIIVTKIGENKKSYDIFIIDTSKVEVKQNKKVIYSFFNFKSYEEVLELGLEQALKLIK